jgi:hypothetical protein
MAAKTPMTIAPAESTNFDLSSIVLNAFVYAFFCFVAA